MRDELLEKLYRYTRCQSNHHCIFEGVDQLHEYAKSLVAELARLRDLCRWIPVNERSPEMYVTCLVRYRVSGLKYPKGYGEGVSFGVFVEGSYWTIDSQLDCLGGPDDPYVVEWLPLPDGTFGTHRLNSKPVSWIPVGERLPEEWKRCAVKVTGKCLSAPEEDYFDYDIGSWTKQYGWNLGHDYLGDYPTVTHWHPLPPEPEVRP